MGVRKNLVTDVTARDEYIQAVRALDQEFPGVTTAEIGIAGPALDLSTWDIFVYWHYATMNIATPPGSGRNAAHRAPVFLPWHRWMMILLEGHMQRVIGNPDFGLPYWDWAADGDHPVADQANLPVWSVDVMGGSGSPVTTGPFAFDPNDPTSFRVRFVESLFTGRLETADRGLSRQLGEDPDFPSLPTTAHVQDALDLTIYDRAPFNRSSGGFRNRLEGWVGPAVPGMHNRVHVWIGGDMGPGTSPNDPAFYMNHCNVDRIWEAWMIEHGRVYRPEDSAPQELFRQRLNDPLVSLITADEPLISDMLDVSSTYTYDVLP